MSDIEEQEISFGKIYEEEIGLLENAVKIGKAKRLVKLNLKIKRPKQKAAQHISQFKRNVNKPLEYDNEFVENLTDESKSEFIPKLCNGENCPGTDQIMSAIEELRDLIKQSCNETRDIRKDLFGIKKAMVDDNPSYIPFTRGPCRTLDDLNLLDNRIQEDEPSRKALEELLETVPDPSIEKYIRNCLSAIISLKVAAQCAWIAKKGSPLLTVNKMAIMGIICECTQKKFPTASASVIEKNMRTWFGQTKDRYRRTLEARSIKSEAEESLDHLK